MIGVGLGWEQEDAEVGSAVKASTVMSRAASTVARAFTAATNAATYAAARFDE